MKSLDDTFVPRLRDDVLRRDLGLEAVAWSPIRTGPVPLDAVARVMFDLIDGEATIADMAEDVHAVVELPTDVALDRVRRVIDLFDKAGLLCSSQPQASREPELFISPVSSCMEASSCTGRVTPVNVEIGSHRLRIACGSRRVARHLRGALEEHVVDEQAPLGFMLRAPRRRTRQYVLFDRGGFVLGTAGNIDQALHMVGSHLAALLPVPGNRARLRVRALERDGRAILVAWPLLFIPPVDEATLAGAGFAILDRLTVDLAGGSVVVDPAPWPALASRPPATGHAGKSDVALTIDQVVMAAPTGGQAPSPAQAAASIVGELLGGPRDVALDGVARLVSDETVRVQTADPTAPSGLARLLESSIR